jgi:type II secretion system protein D
MYRNRGPSVKPASIVLLLLVCAAAAADPAAGQEPAVRATPEGVLLDFQDADLRLVLAALAEAGSLNVVYSDLPVRRVTLRTNHPVPPDQIPALLRSVAQGHGLIVTEEGPFLRIEAATGGTGDPRHAGAGETEPTDEVRLFVYPLRHARADRLAATLQAVFTVGRAAGAAPMPGLTRPPLSQRLREQRIMPTVPGDTTAVVVEMGPVEATGLPGELHGEVQIVPDELTNAILVRAGAADWEIVRQAIEALDLRPLQVLIEAMIVEVRQAQELEFGVSGAGTDRRPAERARVVGGAFMDGDADRLVLRVMQVGGLDLDVTLSALAATGRVRILSRPVLVAQNNQEARIMVGSQRPFIQVFRSLPTDAAVRDQVVQYRDVGTSLTIRPTINPDGHVNLQVVQEVSTATAETQFGAPVISTREASTHLFVRDGQTVVIGGLVERQHDEHRSGIPVLKDIPLIGFLFGTTRNATTRSELFLFLTPHIIASDEDADRVRIELQDAPELLRRELPRDETLIPPQRP